MPPRKKVNATTYISNPVATGENIAFSVTPVVNSTESDAATSATATAVAVTLISPLSGQRQELLAHRSTKDSRDRIQG